MERITMVSRDEPRRVIETSTQNACVRRDFYSLEKENGERTAEPEHLLAEMESQTATALRELEGTGCPPSAEVRDAISWFLAFQANRGNDQRALISQSNEHMLKMILAAAPEEWIRSRYQEMHGREPSALEVESPKKRFRSVDKYTIKTHPNEHIRSIFESAESRVPYFLERSWKLLSFPEPALITSDRPFALLARPPHQDVGLATADYIAFPINSQQLLLMGQPGKFEGNCDGTEEVARFVNRTLFRQCFEWAFHRPTHSPLAGVTVKPRRSQVISGIGVGEKFRALD